MVGQVRFMWAAAVLLAVTAAPLLAQDRVIRLPTVMPPSDAFPGQLVGHPESGANVLQSPLEPTEPVAAGRPSDARNGMFQKLLLTYGWMAGGGSQGLGMNEAEVKAVLALPCPRRDWPLLITPGFSVTYLEGPTVPDLPPQLYNAYTQFRWIGGLESTLGFDLAVTLGEYGDFEQGTSEAFRVRGHGAAVYRWSPTLHFVLGASYPDLEDIDVIPVGGVIWNPNDDFKLEALFPRPRIARRINCLWGSADGVEDWLYLAGEFGNDTWAIRRASGADDVVNYSDWRLVLGVERKRLGGLDARFEVVYVFQRELYYYSITPDFDPSDTLLLRAGVTY